MRPPDEEPKIEHTGTRDRTTETHPAYAQISANRGHGGSLVLYGSDFIHNDHVTIRINRSVLDRELNRDWPFAREAYIEVQLSEAQWATFVSSLNAGSGVQCTLRQIDGHHVPSITAPKQRAAQFKNEVKQDCAQALEALAALREQINELPVAKKHKDTLLAGVYEASRKLDDSIPFVATSFNEYVEAGVEKAKIEIHAHLQNVVQRAGLQALGAKEQPILLPGESDE